MSAIYSPRELSYLGVGVASLTENRLIEKDIEVLGRVLIDLHFIREFDMTNCEPETCPMKPFKGHIRDWTKIHFNRRAAKQAYPGENVGLGYYIHGTCLDHPEVGTNENFHTSWVMYHDETNLIETRNSQYLLIGKEAT